MSVSAFSGGSRADQSVSTTPNRFVQDCAKDAWEAHRALLLAEARQPALRDNPAWAALRGAASANFIQAFEEVGK